MKRIAVSQFNPVSTGAPLTSIRIVNIVVFKFRRWMSRGFQHAVKLVGHCAFGDNGQARCSQRTGRVPAITQQHGDRAVNSPQCELKAKTTEDFPHYIDTILDQYTATMCICKCNCGLLNTCCQTACGVFNGQWSIVKICFWQTNQ